jgi:hypothetical protein
MKASMTRSKLGLAHLSVAHEHARFGHQLAQLGRNLVDGFDAVVHEVNLAAALQLLLDGGADQLFIPTATTVWMAMRSLGGVSITLMSRRPSMDMCSVRGMGVADMASTSIFAQLLEALLVAHAEALLLVDDDQAEVGNLRSLESTRWVPMRMSTLPVSTRSTISFCCFGGAEARDHFDIDGEGAKRA